MISNPLLETWSYSAAASSAAIVLPDGCRDLIGRWSHGRSPVWIVTSVDQCARRVSVASGESMFGFRLKPGCSMDRLQLLEYATELSHNTDMILIFVRRDTRLRLPDASVTPTVEPTLDGVPFSKSLGKISPRKPGLRDKQDSIDEQPVVFTTAAQVARLARQQVLDAVPLSGF